ncbi:MAG: hypothetical protein WD207_05870 [Xanthobacteraceae bacterium]
MVRTRTIIPILAAALLLASATLAAEEFESHYSSVAIENCRTVDKAKPGDGEWQVWACEGRAGLAVVRSAADLRETVSIGRSVAAARQEPAANAWFGPFNLAGDTIEWRKEKGAKAPFAVIQRWSVSDSENIDATGRPTPYGLLIVTRLPPGPVCHTAIIDVKENAEPNSLARKIADENARAFRCGTDPVLAAGNRGRAIELIRP